MKKKSSKGRCFQKKGRARTIAEGKKKRSGLSLIGGCGKEGETRKTPFVKGQLKQRHYESGGKGGKSL